MSKKFKSVFDTPIRSVDGEENFLNKFKGKVLLFVNTTGHCGNAPQWPVIEAIAADFPNDLQVIYVPTNDFCGSVTYGEYKKGIKNGKESQEYALNTYGVTSPFTELVSSRNTFWQLKNMKWDDKIQGIWHTKNTHAFLENQPPRSDLYDFLVGTKRDLLGGNFHKFLTNKKGEVVAFFHNGTLLDDAYNNGEKTVYSSEVEMENMKKVIAEVIQTGYTTNEWYQHEPNKKIFPKWVSYIRNHSYDE